MRIAALPGRPGWRALLEPVTDRQHEVDGQIGHNRISAVIAHENRRPVLPIRDVVAIQPDLGGLPEPIVQPCIQCVLRGDVHCAQIIEPIFIGPNNACVRTKSQWQFVSYIGIKEQARNALQCRIAGAEGREVGTTEARALDNVGPRIVESIDHGTGLLKGVGMPITSIQIAEARGDIKPRNGLVLPFQFRALGLDSRIAAVTVVQVARLPKQIQGRKPTALGRPGFDPSLPKMAASMEVLHWHRIVSWIDLERLTADFSMLLVLRLAAGFTGALVFVSGAGLTSAAAVGGSKSRAPTLLGLYFAGAGIGVTASALAVPPLLESVGWRGGWLVLGMLALGATVFGWFVLRHAPKPFHASAGTSRRDWSPRFMACMLLSYGLFGAGYIAYATFIIAYLRSEEGFSGSGITRFWSIFGLASVAAVFVWGPLLGRLKGSWGTAATLGVVTLGSAVPLLWSAPAGAYLSAALFGGSFLAVLAAVTSFARRATKPHAWTAAIATLTIAFGLGQCIGPVLSGALSDRPSGLRAGLWLSAGILVIATFVAMFQAEPTEQG